MKKSLAYVLAAAALVAFGSLAPAVRGNADEGTDSELKFAEILETQKKIAASQEQILASLNEVKAELKIIKIRATR